MLSKHSLTHKNTICLRLKTKLFCIGRHDYKSTTTTQTSLLVNNNLLSTRNETYTSKEIHVWLFFVPTDHGLLHLLIINHHGHK